MQFLQRLGEEPVGKRKELEQKSIGSADVTNSRQGVLSLSAVYLTLIAHLKKVKPHDLSTFEIVIQFEVFDLLHSLISGKDVHERAAVPFEVYPLVFNYVDFVQTKLIVEILEYAILSLL